MIILFFYFLSHTFPFIVSSCMFIGCVRVSWRNMWITHILIPCAESRSPKNPSSVMRFVYYNDKYTDVEIIFSLHIGETLYCHGENFLNSALRNMTMCNSKVQHPTLKLLVLTNYYSGEEVVRGNMYVKEIHDLTYKNLQVLAPYLIILYL